MTSLRVFRAGFVPPPVNDAVTVTRVDRVTTDLLPQDPDFYRYDRRFRDLAYYDYCTDDEDDDKDDKKNDDDDKERHIFVAQRTAVDHNCLFRSVSFALTGNRCRVKIKCGYLFKHGRLNIFSFRCQ